jgi:hypothetical protein
VNFLSQGKIHSFEMRKPVQLYSQKVRQFSEVHKLENDASKMEKEKQIAEKNERSIIKEKDQALQAQMKFTQIPQQNSKVSRIYLISLVF